VRREPAFARAYARALYDLAQERGQGDVVGRELEQVVRLVAGEPELKQFFARPWVAPATKRAVALEVATRSGVSALMRDFVALVARQGRAEHIEVIAAAYQRQVDEAQGRVRATVRTAVPLTDGERQALRSGLARALQKQGAGPVPHRLPDVVLDEEVDPTLLGGFVAEVGTFIADGSLDGQLARIRSRLARG
jgi:F-type H+-transporting ATPase subunit delta